MSSVSNTTSTTPADLFASLAGKSETKASGAAADLEGRFLTLLMAQIKNQDPLNPMDNAQVTSQMAQLNTVSGIEKLNTSMTQLLNGYNEAQGMQAAAIIGKNVMIAGNSLPLADGKAFGGIALVGNADSVKVTIKDASGKEIQTEELGEHKAGTFYFAWDGKDADGNAVPDGNYSFSVTATSGGKDIEAATAQVGTVSAVVRGKNEFLLDLGGMGMVPIKDVQQIL
ncbi:flagellar biosynthesis protein FlgD [Azonexus hydrophilus]|uniref:Basal-body rod modification protein FlgD n=1 Tax=Azonexus hydrophilus TaxID=418702 RepID=A0A1R1IE36_9RHOO|nr:flagellar hook assembly protein FlgD [Azonexus hydrophilus]OMG56930.1 flagellar biosynthesis protein FlgD [Azonexus hydrophilus]